MKELRLEAKIENINAVTDFVNEELEALDCPMKAQFQIDIALDELFSNIAQYAYGDGGGDAVVRVEAAEAGGVWITFADWGTPYDPLSREDPDISLGLEEREIGGLGIFLVKKTMDDVRYEYADGQNIMRILKKY